MSRFSKYLKLSSGGDHSIETFRSLKLRLVESETPHKKVVEEIEDKYLTGNELTELLGTMNKDLRKVYRGKYRWDFCIDEGIRPDEIKIDEAKKQRIKGKWYEFENSLVQAQKKFEQMISKGLPVKDNIVES